VGCQKYGFYFSKTRSQNVAGEKPYFQKVPLIGERTQPSFSLIPLFPAYKGISVDEKEVTLLLSLFSA